MKTKCGSDKNISLAFLDDDIIERWVRLDYLKLGLHPHLEVTRHQRAGNSRETSPVQTTLEKFEKATIMQR